MSEKKPTIFALVLIGLIRLYQNVVSPWLRPACRFQPTCSHYAVMVIRQHGVGRGVYLAARRLLRCAPWGRESGDQYEPSSSTHCD